MQLFFSPMRIFKNTYRTCLFYFCFCFCFLFFSSIQRTQKSDYGRKRRGKWRERGKERRASEYVPLLLSYTGAILGTFLNEKKHSEKKLALLALVIFPPKIRLDFVLLAAKLRTCLINSKKSRLAGTITF